MRTITGHFKSEYGFISVYQNYIGIDYRGRYEKGLKEWEGEICLKIKLHAGNLIDISDYFPNLIGNAWIVSQIEKSDSGFQYFFKGDGALNKKEKK